jgi:cytochrome c5
MKKHCFNLVTVFYFLNAMKFSVFLFRGWQCAMLATGLLLAACSGQSDTPDAQAIAYAQQVMPQDASVAALYERSCRTCHSQQASQAPLAGFVPQWTPRLAQGMPVLVGHVRDGFKGMPARGYCNDCTDPDYAALIRFMSTHQP